MKRIVPSVFFALIIVFAYGYAAGKTSVAVLPSDGDAKVFDNDDLSALTDKMRSGALKALPPENFDLLTQDVVVKRLGGAEKFINACKESSCIVDLGKEAQVDYIAQASIGKIRNKMRIKVEVYEVATSKLVGMYDGGGDFFDDFFALLKAVDENVPNVFGKIPGAVFVKAKTVSQDRDDNASAAEAAFMLGERERATMEPFVIKGSDQVKLEMIKKLMGIVRSAAEHYKKSAEYGSEKWTFRAKNRMAELFLIVAAKVGKQEIDVRDKNGNINKERLFVERIQVAQQLPSYYEQARTLFQASIDLARKQGSYNSDVVAAQDGYIEMFYRDCQNFYDVGDDFAKAPMPDSVAMMNEFIDEGMSKGDAILAVREDLGAYREEIMKRSAAAKQGALPRCASGIKAAAHYGIKNKWTDSLFVLVKKIDAKNEILSTQIKEFNPKK